MNKKTFVLISFSQITNMFAYAGMQSILLLYLVQHAFMADTTANRILGAFGALFCATHIIGGWAGDKLLGPHLSMIIGSTILCFGYFCLILTPYNLLILYLSLAATSLGNGLFSTNAATLIRSLQTENTSQIDSAFTLYYLAINVGSVLAKLSVPWIQIRYGWQQGFIACFIGAIAELSLQIYMYYRYRYYKTSENKLSFIPVLHWGPLKKSGLIVGGVGLIILLANILHHETLAENTVWLSAVFVVLVMLNLYIKALPAQRYGLRVLYVLIIQSILFFVLFQQMDTSLTLFALRHISPTFYIGSFPLFSWSAGQFKTLNPLWVICFSPLIVWLYRKSDQASANTSISVKFVWGFFSLFISFLIWGGVSTFASTPLLSPWVMVVGYLFFSIGEILIGGLGLAVIARFAPPTLNGIMMGGYYIASGVAIYIGSLIANIATFEPDIPSPSVMEDMQVYSHLFWVLASMAGISMLISLSLLPLLKKWERRFYAVYMHS